MHENNDDSNSDTGQQRLCRGCWRRVLVLFALVILVALVLLEINLQSVGTDKIVVTVARRHKLSRNNATAAIDTSVDSVDDDDDDDDDDDVIIKSCDQYNGVLMIDRVDVWAGAGATFFGYMVNYLIYAEMHNLMPLIHLDPRKAGKTYDANVHSGSRSQVEGDVPNITLVKPAVVTKKHVEDSAAFEMRQGPPIPSEEYNVPGTPNFNQTTPKRKWGMNGNGVWNTYFHPVSPKLNFTDPNCTDKALYIMSQNQVFPGMHYCASWKVRANDGPIKHCGNNTLEQRQKLKIAPQNNESHHDWIGRNRQKAARMVKAYYKPHIWLQNRIDETNPRKEGDLPCLAIHIRLSDKGADRGNGYLKLDDFFPYAEAFVEAGGETIFIATDTSHIFVDIEQTWPPEIAKSVVRQQGVFLTDTNKGIFDLIQHHRSNTEALTEMYAMAKCDLIVHGYSSMSEAAFKLNPKLHNFSVNLDYPIEERQSMESFKTMIKKVLNK